MRSAFVVWLIAGCGFSGAPLPPGEPGDDPVDDPGGDVGTGDPGVPGEPDDPGPPVPPGDPGPVAARCDVSDPALRLCLTFDSLPLVEDLASPANVIAELSDGLQSATGTSAQLDGQSHIHFAEANDLDVTELTIDLRIAPDPIPRDRVYGILDNNAQYSVAYDDDGRVWCGIGAQFVPSTSNFRSGSHHIACRYDSRTDLLRVYIDGDVRGCLRVSSGIPTSGRDGLVIGANYIGGGYQEHFEGSLDSLHLYARALSDAEICTAAGRTRCDASCPGSGGRDRDGDRDD